MAIPKISSQNKMIPLYLTSPLLTKLEGINHGFFTRRLNSDSTNNSQSDKMILASLQLNDHRIIRIKQTHSARAIIVANQPKGKITGDALITGIKHHALAVMTADCGVVLMADPKAEVIAAIHAGWRGSLGGIIEQAIEAMVSLGGMASEMVAGIGPTISQANYEVSGEFARRFISKNRENHAYFSPAKRSNHFMFDLPGHITSRLKSGGVGQIENIKRCTFAEPELFYSYRRATVTGNPSDNGRLLSVIALNVSYAQKLVTAPKGGIS